MAFCAWCGNQVTEVSYAACPKCGNPTNGAQRVGGAASGGTNTVALIIGIVAGVFVLVAVIGILAAIAIPNLVTAQQRSRQKRTMADVRSVATALEAYAKDKNEYPRGTYVADLSPVLSPAYIVTLPALDGWGTAMKYECWPAEGPCKQYAVGSAGADKTWEHDSLREYAAGTTTQRFDADLVFSDGNFMQYPEGVSSQ